MRFLNRIFCWTVRILSRKANQLILFTTVDLIFLNRVGQLEVLQELAEMHDCIQGHGIIHADSDAGVKEVSFHVHHPVLLCLLNKLLFQAVISGNSKDYVDTASEVMLGDVGVVA